MPPGTPATGGCGFPQLVAIEWLHIALSTLPSPRLSLPALLTSLLPQVSWALRTLSVSGAGAQLPEGQQEPPTGCPGRLLELKGMATGEHGGGVGRPEELEPLCASGSGRQPIALISTPGNIRVLCRLRPGTPSSLVSSEPGPGGTVTTCYRGHRRRFRLDWVFPPDASQEEVMLRPHTCVDPPSEALVPLPCPSALRELKCLDSSREGGGRLGGRTGSRAGHITFLPGFPLCVPSPSCAGPGGTDLVQTGRLTFKNNVFTRKLKKTNLSEVTAHAQLAGERSWGAAVVGMVL